VLVHRTKSEINSNVGLRLTGQLPFRKLSVERHCKRD